ncbi:MAG: transcriptional regulator GlxA family with amidase domain [Cyclobacteriaceae bacterium]|jgi:transcriptional regulator GlxA family with amidase domain
MKHLSILVPRGLAILDTIIGTMNLFQMANNFQKKEGLSEKGLFEIDLVGISSEPHFFNKFFSVAPTKSIDEVAKTDLIIIPGLVGNLEEQIELNYPFVDWIRKQRIQQNAELASLCRGAFLLAETGLMNGKSCATHWLTHDKFRQMYPAVNLIPEKVITEDNGIYSSGGAYSFLNLLLYLIEKYYGRESAIWCSKVSEIEFDRIDQNQFVIFNGQKEHTDEGVLNIQEYVEKHFSEKISVEHLAEQTTTSSRNLVRRFKKATNNTPIEYIQRVRIEAAKKKLESTTMTILQVMVSSGYNDDKAFRTIFKRYAGLTPLEYRNKYNREMAYA